MRSNVIEFLKQFIKTEDKHLSAKGAYNLARFGVIDSKDIDRIVNLKISKIEDYIKWKAREKGSTAIIVDLPKGEEDLNEAIIQHFDNLGYRLIQETYSEIGEDIKYLIISWADGGQQKEKGIYI